MSSQISLIVAMCHDRVIGYQNKMPWHLPAELAYFKRLTMGKTIIMGRKTFDSIGHALPGRRNIVISHQTNLWIPNCEVYHDLETMLTGEISQTNEELMVIGGATLFKQTLPFATTLYLTLIDAKLPGDAFFPEWDSEQWETISIEYHQPDPKNHYAFQTQLLKRRSPNIITNR